MILNFNIINNTDQTIPITFLNIVNTNMYIIHKTYQILSINANDGKKRGKIGIANSNVAQVTVLCHTIPLSFQVRRSGLVSGDGEI